MESVAFFFLIDITTAIEIIEFGIFESEENAAKLIGAAKTQADGEKMLEEAQSEALEALKKGNVEIVFSS